MIRKAVVSDHSDLVRLFILENQHNAQLAPDIVRETKDVLTLEELKQILADNNQYLVVKEIDGVAVGALLGSINKIWPWKETVSTYVDRHGETKPLLEKSILPGSYEGDPQILGGVALAIVGFALIFLLEKLATKKD